MAIYVNNLGDSQSLPLAINDPQDGQSLVWSEEQGAYINATVDATAATEVIQDTVAQMVETDPDGTQVSLRLVTSYDDATGKLLFNVVSDSVSGGGAGTTLLTVQEDGVTRGAIGALNFVGSTVTMDGATAIITGGLAAVEVLTNGVTQGDVKKFNFDRLNVSVNGDAVTIQGPDISAIVADLATKASTQYVDDAIASIGAHFSGDYNDLTNKPAIPAAVDLTGYATQNYVDSAVANVSVDLTGYATEAFVNTGLANLVSSSPATLDTLNELATALGNDPNFATTISNQIGTKIDAAQLDAAIAIEHQHHIDGDAQTLADAKAYTDAAIAVEHQHHIDGDAATLASARSYADGIVADFVTDAELSAAITQTTLTQTNYTNAKFAEATNYADVAIANLVNGAPATLDTLKELADALGNNQNLATTIAGDLASKADLTYVDNQLALKLDATALTGYATESYVDTAISDLVAGAPTALDTLKELADALQASDSLAQSIANQLATMPTMAYLSTNYATQQSVNQQVTDAVIQTTAYIDAELADFARQSVLVDGVTIFMDANGVISAPDVAYVLPTATTSTLGGVKVDGTTITADADGVITANGLTINDVAVYLADQGYQPLSATSLKLEDLNDTYVTGATDGQALVWNAANNRWQPGTAVGGTSGGITITDVGTYLTANGYATQTYVQGQINNLVNGAQATLDTLNELAAALNNDANFATSILTALDGKLAIAGGTMTGSLILAADPAQPLEAATKQYVDAQITAGVSAGLANVGSSNVGALNDLTDVDTTGLQDTYVLTYDAASSLWVPTAGVAGPAGAAGAQGPAGVSISSATVSITGRLLVTLTDNTVVDAGNVSGIKTAVVDANGDLIITKQDNTVINAGNVEGPQGIQGPQGAKGETGDQGPQGPEGESIASATVNGVGHLLVTLTDNRTIDAGSVVGPKGDTGATGAVGPQGATGPAGVGIAGATVDANGRLIITKTDTTTVDAGTVVGPQGPQGSVGPQGPTGSQGIGIFSATVDAAGDLQLTLTDASIINAGYVRGAQGPAGPQGAAGVDVTSATVDAGGNLQITLSDATTLNAGYVVGPKGDKGDTGEVGPQGPQGIQGVQGPQGDSYTINNTTGSVEIFGLTTTTQPGYDFEVGYSNEAGVLATPRTITLTGDVTGLVTFDGSQNVSMLTNLSGVTTNDVTEGTNQYFTQARARAALSSSADGTIGSLISYDSATGVIKYRANTTYITEGSNLYFTNTRADARADYRIGQSSIDALADVNTTAIAPVNGDVLTWTGSAWTPAAPTGGGGTGNVLSVNNKTGAVTLTTDDVAEGLNNQYFTATRFDARFSSKDTDDLAQGTTNKYFSDALARNALNAGTGLLYNSATGTFTLNANTDQVAEGSANLYFTNQRFDTRLGQSTLDQFADVADTTPTTGQALAWNGSAWAPTTISAGTGGGGGASSGIFRAEVQVEYAANGDLSAVNVLSGGISANIVTATSTTATVEFTFTGSVCAPLSIQVYGYQRVNNVYVTRAIGSDFTSRTLAGGGASGSPTAFNSFNPSTNKMTLSLTKSLTGATAGLGQTTSAVVSFLLSSI